MLKNRRRRSKFIRRLSYNVHSIFGLLKIILSDRQFLYLSCIVVGFLSALAVTLLKLFAHGVLSFTKYVTHILQLPYFTSVLPVIGIVLTVLVVRKFLGGSIEKGTSQLMIAVAKKSSYMPKKQMYAQIITSSLTVGMGGSAGLESPIAITGGAFGSNYAQNFRLNYKDRTLLLACGVAAGIATAFNAPLAGVLFATELILVDVTVSAFIPIMLSSAVGVIVSNLLLQESILLQFKDKFFFDFSNTFYYVILGVAAGFLSVYHARLFRRIEHKIGIFSKNAYKRAIIGAGILGILIFIFPPLFGEGYDNLKILAKDNAFLLLDNSLFENLKGNDWWLLLILTITMMVKSVATGLTLGSGGNGGNFAPSLFVGAYLGYIISKFFNITGIKALPIDNFTVVGMAAMLSGLFHAPLTAIFLIAEISGGYGLIIPLMIVASISYAICVRYDKYSMDIYNIADKGLVFTFNRDRNIFNKIDIALIYKSDISVLNPNFTLNQVKNIFGKYNQEFIPVVDKSMAIVGIIFRFDFTEKLLSDSEIDMASLVKTANVSTMIENPMNIIRNMDEQNVDYVLLTKNGKYVGYLTKEIIMDAYRNTFKNLQIE